jgi:hypothetical protein
MKRVGGRDIVLGTALLTASACVIAPEGGTTLPSRTSQVSFEGYSSAAGDTVVLTARNFRTGAFEEFASTVSGDTETFAEDQFGNHPALFPWSITAPIGVTQQELDNRFTFAGCGPDVVSDGQGDGPSGEDTRTTSSDSCLTRFKAEIEVRVGDSTLWVFPQGGVRCVTSRVSSGQDLLAASSECSPAGGEPLQLIALH